MAGGEGLRLRPFTDNIPKAMISVAEKPLILWIINWLKSHGIRKVDIGVDYKQEVLRDYLKDGSEFGVEIKYNDHHGAEGTGDAFRLAIENLGIDDEDFVAMNGDELTDLPLGTFYNFHKERNPFISIAACQAQLPYGVIETQPNGELTQFKEKPVINDFVNMGVYIFNRRAIEHLPERGNIEYTTFPKLARMGKIFAYKHSGFWRTVNDVKDLKLTEERLKSLGYKLY